MSDHRHIFASPGSSNEEASRTSHYPTLPSPSSSVSAPPEPPLLLIKITAFRLLNTAILLAFGIPKPVPSYRGESAVPTTLDWILGILCAAALYWLGLFEGVDPPVLKWLLHDDYAVALILTMIFSLTGAHEYSSRRPKFTDSAP
ncbi:hypothetical protein FA95DRAFT_1489447 [Auriscalpium vulgare]|uniref:Uncharacterized protein n=1 Tax=Auriscalpium vulgare TaxID=40419 RepID=A0ACB8RZS3_9AGAM|nr:hypothetical protein FA95DRAFT_1489447 [Auriscalpium vulgare]